MNCKENAGISIDCNHEKLKSYVLRIMKSLVIKIVNNTRTGELHVQDIFNQVC